MRYVWVHDSYIYVTWLIHIWDKNDTYMWHTHAWVVSHTCMSHVTYMYRCTCIHDSCIYMNPTYIWLIHIWLIHIYASYTYIGEKYVDQNLDTASFAKEPFKRDYILQKRPAILCYCQWSISARTTPTWCMQMWFKHEWLIHIWLSPIQARSKWIQIIGLFWRIQSLL